MHREYFVESHMLINKLDTQTHTSIPTLPMAKHKHELFLVFYPSALWCFQAGILQVK